MSPTVFVVTSVHNDLAHTQTFLTSLRRSTYPKLKIIVTDDGSTDGTSDYLLHEKNVLKVSGNGRLWWTGGLNAAIIKALKLAKDTDYLFTINNDCIIPPNLIQQMLALSKKQGAVIGAIEKDLKSHKITTGAVSMNWKTGKWLNNKSLARAVSVKCHTTKGLLLPVQVIKETGLLDEKHLPHYASDIEYTHRLVSLGYKLIVDPDLFVYCDQQRTGLVPKNKTSLSNLFRLAFDRKSTINLFDHYYLIKLTCPSKYKLINYWRLAGKCIFLLKSAVL